MNVSTGSFFFRFLRLRIGRIITFLLLTIFHEKNTRVIPFRVKKNKNHFTEFASITHSNDVLRFGTCVRNLLATCRNNIFFFVKK